MALKFGVLTSPVEDVVKQIKVAKEMGFDFIEIGIEPPMGDPEILIAKKDTILGLLKEYGMFTIGHTAWFCDLGSLVEDLRRAWIEEAKNYIDAAHKLGIKLLNFHAHYASEAYMEIDKYKKQVFDNLVDSMEELMGYAKQFDIKLMLENIPSKKMQLNDFRYIVDRLPGLGVHLDVGHAFITGGMECVSRFIRTFGERIAHVHVHDNNGEEDQHLGIGKGKINYEKVVEELRKIGYDKTITFEVFFGGKKALLESRKKIEKLWK